MSHAIVDMLLYGTPSGSAPAPSPIPIGMYLGPAWARDAVLYHLFPLGQCGAERANPLDGVVRHRIGQLGPWLHHAREVGADTVLLGPVLRSETHGYDIIDAWRVDERLGDEADLVALVRQAHDLGLRVVLDAVFNHVGRGHGAFQDVLERGQESSCWRWFSGIRPGGPNPKGDPFTYHTWDNHWDLVKLDVRHPPVAEHHLQTVDHWVRDLGIDGLRLDAADILDRRFQRRLARHCAEHHPELWLMGEVVHGDYNRWAKPGALHSTTNYELYKALWSSHLDRNLFELAHALQRQAGLYPGLSLVTFLENHDQPRLASRLPDPAHLYTAHLLLLTLPGTPTLYYGGEWGVEGQGAPTHDWDLRPRLELDGEHPQPALVGTIRRCVDLRRELAPLRHGTLEVLHLASEQLVFARELDGERVVVAVNIAAEPATVELPGAWWDALAGEAVGGRIQVPAGWGRVLTPR